MKSTVLFVSRRGTVRSALASAQLDALDPQRFASYALGRPEELGDAVHPMALQALRQARIAAPHLEPRSWDAFRRPDAPRADFVILLDRSIAELQPSWPGQPEQALWDYPDLLLSEAEPDPQQFMRLLLSLRRRLELLVNLTRHRATRADLRSDLRDMAFMP